MSRLFGFVLVCLALSSCGRGVLWHADQGVFTSYADDFAAAARAQGCNLDAAVSSIPIYFDKSVSVKATCSKGGALAVPSIRVNEARWAEFDDNERRLLIFHELGHCILDREHTDTISVMREPLLSGAVFAVSREILDAELFAGCAAPARGQEGAAATH